MSKIKALAVAAALACSAGASHALTLLIDDFNTPPPVMTDRDNSLGNGYSTLFSGAMPTSVGNLASTRTVSQDWHATQGIPGATTSVSVGGGANGALLVDNGAGIDTDVRVVWTIPAFALPPTGPYSFFFQILFSNLGTLPGGATPLNDIQFNFVGGSNFAKAVSVGQAVNQGAFFALTAGEATSFAGGGTLTMTLSGAPAWDFAIDSFGLSIPEPMTLTLVGAALMGAGLASRRRKVS